MLPAVVKLCCGISYPHLRSMAGLQRTAVAVIGQELTHLQRLGQIQQQVRAPAGWKHNGLKKEQLFYVQQGQEAMRKALSMLEDKEGWKVELTENNGDVIYSKVIPGARKVFRLEAVLEAGVDKLYDLLFVRVEEMHQWNPSLQHIKVLKRVGPETIVTHEVSAETAAGNLIGQRDFLNVRHSCKQESCLYLGGAAIQLESVPPLAGFVRAEAGPTCIVIQALDEEAGKCHFTWLVNMDLKIEREKKKKSSSSFSQSRELKRLAAKVHCQSGFAPSSAGFYQTSPQTSCGEHHPGLIGSVQDVPKWQHHPVITHRGKTEEILDLEIHVSSHMQG